MDVIRSLIEADRREYEGLNDSEKRLYMAMRNCHYTHEGAIDAVIARRSKLFKFYDSMMGIYNIPKRLFKDEIKEEAIKFITDNCQSSGKDGYALEYVPDELEFEIRGVSFSDTFFSIRRVEPYS